MPINLGTASDQAFCAEINKVFHRPKNKTCAFPTGSLIKDDESALFAQIHQPALIAKQHAKVVEAVQKQDSGPGGCFRIYIRCTLLQI